MLYHRDVVSGRMETQQWLDILHEAPRKPKKQLC